MTLEQQLEQLLRVNTTAAQILAEVRAGIAELTKTVRGSMGGAKGGKAAGDKAAGGKAASGGGGGGGLGGMLGSLTSALGGVLAAVGGVIASFLAVPAAVAGIAMAAIPFVKALSPGTVELFQQAMDNLQATIGSALLPIVVEATAALSAIGGIILPLMNQLRPLIAMLAAAFTSLITGAMRAVVVVLGALLTALTPLIKAFVGLVEYVAQVIEVWAVIIEVLLSFSDVMDALKLAVMGPLAPLGMLGDGAMDLKGMFGALSAACAAAVAGLLQMAGATEFLAKIVNGLKKAIASRRAPAAGLTAAPGNAGITDANSIANKFAEAAFKATAGGTAAKSDTELLEDILKSVEAGMDGKAWEKIIENGVRAGMKALPGGTTVSDTANVLSRVFDSSATGADAAAAAREAGWGWIGAQTARVGKYSLDLVGW